MAKYCTSEGQALQLGYLAKQRIWKLDDVEIGMHVYCPNDLDFTITFLNHYYQERDEGNNETSDF